MCISELSHSSQTLRKGCESTVSVTDPVQVEVEKYSLSFDHSWPSLYILKEVKSHKKRLLSSSLQGPGDEVLMSREVGGYLLTQVAVAVLLLKKYNVDTSCCRGYLFQKRVLHASVCDMKNNIWHSIAYVSGRETSLWTLNVVFKRYIVLV